MRTNINGPFVWIAIAVALLTCASAIAAPYKSVPGAPDGQVDFAAPDAVLKLDTALSPYHGPSGGQVGCSDWYMMSAVNDSIRPSTRVLQAGQTADSGLRLIPLSTRPQIGQVATSDSGVYVERVSAYGRRAYRVTIPPATPVALAICFGNAGKPPSLLAWTEPALSQHNRSLAIFIAAVAGLIAAAALIGAGLAAMSGHAPPRWAALTLFLVLLTRLSATGMFDASVATPIGGPYGLMAALAGLTLATGARLADSIAPLREVWPRYAAAFRWAVNGVIALSVLAYLGIPAATFLTDIAIVVGSGLVAVYLVERGRTGSRAARVAAPSAAVFALVTLAAALTTLIGLGDSLIAGDVAGGFAAAGAVLLALAVAAGEGIAAPPSLRLAVLRGDRARSPSNSAPIPSGAHAAEAISSSHQGIFDLDFSEDFLTLSREGASIIGLDDEHTNQPHDAWLARIHPDDHDLYARALADYATHPGIAFRVEFRARSESGRFHWIELRASMLGEGDSARRCLGLIADVTARKEAEAVQVGRALHDPLTGLGNRVALMEELDTMGPGFAQSIFAILDIDRFKTIHASLGDTGGDAVLVEIGRRLAGRFGELARIYRVGGDSFAMLFERGEPDAIGGELVETCNEPINLDGRNVFVTTSVGITRGAIAEDPLELLKHAELALMQAKRHGGACARVYGHELEALAPGDAVVLESELRRALDERQLDVFYQPIVRLTDGTLAGFEALLRWNHPVRGLVSPSDFIGHAEETGLIVALGRYALERATHELSHWQRFFPLAPALFVSVNVSRRQLRDPEFESFVTNLLSTGDIRRGTLKLEITESAIATDDSAHEMLRRLRFLPGAGLSIDDFGTGASSLSQLKDLPFDTVKIDKSFLARHGGTHEDVEGSVVLTSIVSLAHELKRSVVVEGVENARDAEWLKGLGCEFAQGFYFSVPLPANEALEYIAHHFDPTAAKAPPPLASEDQEIGSPP